MPLQDKTILAPAVEGVVPATTIPVGKQPVQRPIMRIAIVCDFPLAHRIPVYQQIAAMPDIDLLVIFSAHREPHLHSDLPVMDFDHVFLHEGYLRLDGRKLHSNYQVMKVLHHFSPQVLITVGFQPTQLYAFTFAAVRGITHVSMSEGSDVAERTPNPLHRLMHRFMFQKSRAFLASSEGGLRLYRRHGAHADQCFTTPPCVDNRVFSQSVSNEQKRFDFIFCDRMEAICNPLFVIEVAAAVATRLQRKISVLMVGSGSQEIRVMEIASRYHHLLDVEFAGSCAPADLPALTRAARVSLLPSRWDRWGIAANEACAAGLPVMTSSATGVAGELVRDGENGFVCELNINEWAERAAALLEDQLLYRRFSDRSRAIVAGYTFEKSATGLISACRRALGTLSASTENVRPRVVVIERQLLHYRVACYERLREYLAAEGVEMQLLVGVGTAAEMTKKDQAVIPWAIELPTRYFLNGKICWQPFGDYARGSDLVVLMHENKMIYNLWLMFFKRPRRLAFWGHGRNMQSQRPHGWRERFKRWTVNKVDWWFAYTESSAELVTDTGFPRARTTVVENAIDTRELAALCEQVRLGGMHKARAEFNLQPGPVGVYVGSLYEEKRIDFLLDAAYQIRQEIPNFQLLVVGAGPQQVLVENAVKKHEWIHYPGPLQGLRKAKALMVADVTLNPGLVGLGVLDSFIGGAPMFTTDCGVHSPEIDYLVSGQNGVMTANTLEDYVQSVVATLSNPEQLNRLRAGATASASRYTIENMATRICNGIMSCLATD